jgi:hypothetical protein
LELSTTLNFTSELVGNDAALADEVPITDGVADVNWMLLVVGADTVMVALDVAPVTDAVMTSVPEQPLSV